MVVTEVVGYAVTMMVDSGGGRGGDNGPPFLPPALRPNAKAPGASASVVGSCSLRYSMSWTVNAFHVFQGDGVCTRAMVCIV